jgi:hypothetical protein
MNTNENNHGAKRRIRTVSVISFLMFCAFISPHAQATNTVGATTPFTTTEAEAGILGGGATVRRLQTIPANDLSSPELEASGRAFVQLTAAGQSVAWVNPVDSCNTINVRYSIPDAPSGGGIDATLDLYINGVLRQALPLNSRQTWVYEGNNGNNNGMAQSPDSGAPHVFYDESRTFISGAALHAGDTIMIRKDAANTASFYYIDCIDLESTAPKLRPANFLSVADYGATGTDTTNVLNAFNSCCAAAKSQGKTLWVPAGKYYMNNNFSPNGVTIMGAGMWYSTVYFTLGQIKAVSCTLQDFCVDAVTVERNQGMGGFNMKGNNWLIDRCWAIHGCWAGYWVCGTNGILRNSRSSTCWGDGLNMNNGGPGGNNMLAENNFTRGCGDDGATIFSDGGNANIIDGAILRHNTTVGMFWANGLRIAGGRHVRAENNLICDDVKEAGIQIGVYGANGSDLDSAVVTGNVVLRCGNQRRPGGIAINAAPGKKNVSVTLTNNIIKDAQVYGILISSDTVTINAKGNTIDHPAQTAIYVQGGAVGSAYFDSIDLVNRIPGKLAFRNDASSMFKVTFGTHNIGIPDTVPTAAKEPVAAIENKMNMIVTQVYKSILVHYFMLGENGTAELALFNSSGRLVWSTVGNCLHQGINSLACPTTQFGSGVFIVRVTRMDPSRQYRSVLAQRVVLTNHQ